MRMSHARNEEGFTMIMTVIGLSLMAALVLVAVTAVNGDSHLTVHDLKQKQAYEAAKAGIDDYAYHLHANNSYWTACANVSGETAVNNVGETTHRLTVPGTTESEYAVELLPSTTGGYSKCDTANATASMLQSTDPLKGTFRIRSNGYAGNAEASIVATFKPASFLDYVYFTQRETSDPVTYGETLVEAAENQCSKAIRDGRYDAEIASGKGYCDVISFVSKDFINGPMHTNDAFAICGSPTLGGSAADPIEVSGPPKGWFSTWEVNPYHSGCTGSDANFKGTLTANSAVLDPPKTNEELNAIADEGGLTFQGQVRICLAGESMTVMTYSTENSCDSPSGVIYPTGPLPANGVVYVEQSGKCPNYTPFEVPYAVTSENEGCGTAYVEGTYSGQLTIATYNDIVVTGSLCMESCSAELPLQGEGTLGLVANNFVRIYHPTEKVHPETCGWHKVNGQWKNECYEDTSRWECIDADGALDEGVTIDAAILAISHSFIVDSYNCGHELGTLTVNGAIAQKYRGAVGTSGGTGYIKSYNYDSRLKYIEPPSFIAPEKTAWVIGRETLE